MAPTAGCSRTKAAAGNFPRSGLWVSSSCICLVMARSRSDLDNETDHEIRRLTFPTSRRLAARSGIEPARRLKGRADALYRIGIVRGVAEEDSPPVCAPTKAKRPLQVTSGTWSSRLGLPMGAVPGIASVSVANAPVIRDHS